MATSARAWFSRIPRPAARWSRLFAYGAIVGIAGGLAAAGLRALLVLGFNHLVGHFAQAASPNVGQFELGVLLLPVAGGLFSGVVMHWLCPGSRLQGTEALTRAFHRDLGELHLKAPLIRGVTAAAVISCGGSTGPEGPIAAIGAAIGSTCGRVFKVTPHERRILLIAGCAAGVGAIFECPLGGALFATGVLYSEPEFESDALVPAFVASVLGYTTFRMFFGHAGPHLLHGATHLTFNSAWELLAYAVLGPLCGGLSIFLNACMRLVRDGVVPRLPGPRWVMPAIGGLATGALACLLPQVMDGQYHFIQNALDWPLSFRTVGGDNWWRWTALFGAVAVAKCVATAFTVGSGSSGGVLGPIVFIGGAAGAFLGALGTALFPDVFPETLRQSLIPVGMAGVLAAAMRTPLAAVVMVTEMTGSYGLIVPLMLVCVSAYVVGRRYGLNHEQVRGMSHSPAHAGDTMIHLLESISVGQVMERQWAATVAPDETLGAIVRRIDPGTRPVFAVVKDGRLLGLISVTDIHRVMEEPGLAEVVIAADLMTERLATVYPDEDLYQAVNVFSQGGHDVLPVVSRDGGRRWLGMLTREGVYGTVRGHIQNLQQVMLREHAGLAAIGREGELQQIVMGVSPAGKDLVQRLLVPLQAVGLSLRQADFRRQFGAQVIAIEQPDGSILCPPPLDMPLQTGQRLLAIVSRDA